MGLIEGSSIDPEIIQQVLSHANGVDRVLVSVGSYCIVFDTAIEDLPAGSFTDRPWDVGNNPKTAVYEWLKSHAEFKIDKDIDNKLLISVAPDEYLKRVRWFQSSSKTSTNRRL